MILMNLLISSFQSLCNIVHFVDQRRQRLREERNVLRLTRERKAGIWQALAYRVGVSKETLPGNLPPPTPLLTDSDLQVHWHKITTPSLTPSGDLNNEPPDSSPWAHPHHLHLVADVGKTRPGGLGCSDSHQSQIGNKHDQEKRFYGTIHTFILYFFY